MPPHRVSPAVLAPALLLLAAACGRSVSVTPSPSGEAPPRAALPLPPVPAVDGPLAIRVVYPAANQVVTSRDSNFIFGSIGSGRATLLVNGLPARVYPNGAFMAFVPNPPASAPRYELVVGRAGDTTRATHPIRYPNRDAVAATLPTPPTLAPDRQEGAVISRTDTIATLNARIDSLRTQLTRDEPIGWVQLGAPSAGGDSDRTIVGRPAPSGTYKWFFTPGTVVRLVGRAGGWARVRLDRSLDVYVDTADVRDLPPSATYDRRVTANMRVRPSAFGVDLSIPMSQRVPYLVEESERTIAITLYGVRANTDLVNYAPGDSMVRTVEWSQEATDRARVTVHLRAAPFGYLVIWDGNALVLKLRGRPAVNPLRPLAGVTIAVDPGHPPAGSTGPTGLYEAQATLPISFFLKTMLEERGARVIMTRTTADAVALVERPVIARRANVHAFVSIHLNAYPDGVNPFLSPGTGTYFFRAHSEPLARAVQRGMVQQIGLKDLGVNYNNLAVVRGTWYPAVLCEGAFIILPDQEAALRTAEFQQRYARGVADGLENYFRTLGTR